MKSLLNRAAHGVCAAVVIAICICALQSKAYAQALSAYQFSSTTGASAVDMSSASTIFGANIDDNVLGPYNIGFNFTFSGTTYSQFYCSSNGYIGMGSVNPGNYLSGTFGSASLSAPIIAGIWRDLYTASDGYVRYLTTGSSPNRVLTVDWKVNNCCSSPTNGYFQLRLYETSNKIEFYYGAGQGAISTGQIGAWVSNSNFASISSAGPSVSNSTGGQSAFPATSTMYTLSPCTGNIGVDYNGTNFPAGGTITVPGSTACGSSTGFGNINATNTNGCAPRNYTMTITPIPGSSIANEFKFTSTGGPSVNGTLPINGSAGYAFTFTPAGMGTRSANISITDDAGQTRAGTISATGTSAIAWVGSIAQGAKSVASPSGDSLLVGKNVNRLSSQNFTPLTLTNNGSVPLTVSSTITGTYASDYVLTPGGTTIQPGASFTPTLRFAPTGVGLEPATLSITAGCETRVYTLAAFAAAPGGEFRMATGLLSNVRLLGLNNRIVPTSELFFNDYRCVGEDLSGLNVQMVSTGNLSFSIDSYYALELDTNVVQGIGAYPLKVDPGTQSYIPSYDYMLTASPGVAPLSANAPLPTPFVIGAAPSQSVIYLNFVAQRPGLRYARYFIYTNSQSFVGVDQNGNTVTGLATFDMFGRGLGAAPSTSTTAGTPKTAVFANTPVGDSATAWFKLYNPAMCQLRINKAKFALIAGDLNPGNQEFSIVTGLSSQLDAAGNHVILPGGVDSVELRFKPVQMGSRRATILMQTNDSTFTTTSNTERGAYYWDVYGVGTTTLDGKVSTFPPGVIDGPAAEQSSASVMLSNTRNTAITIMSVTLGGPDKAEFAIDPAAPIGTLPKMLTPGQMMNFNVLFTPATGSTPGPRMAKLKFKFSDGDSLEVILNAVAGTRTLSVAPNIAFDNVTVPINGTARRTVMVTNTGTLPVTLSSARITGADSVLYTIGMMPRMTLEAGQTEYVELTFKPTSAGTKNAMFEVSGNQVNGTQSISLAGKSAKTKGIVDPSGVTNSGVGTGTEASQLGKIEGTTGADIKFRK